MQPAKPKSGGLETDIHSYLERAACPLCGGDGGKVLLEAGDSWNPKGPTRGLKFKIRRCQKCGTCFTSTRFREDSKHIPFLGKPAERTRKPATAVTRREMRPFLGRAERIQQAHPVPGRVLDLAMGDGVFLHLMRARGWSVCGMEKDRELVARARTQRTIADCSAADVEYDPLPAGPFDAVVLWGLLPRLYRPRQLLERVREILAPGGVIALSVPNFRSAGAWLFRKNWSGLGLPRHLLHFNSDSLRRLLESCGYQLIELSFETPTGMIGDSVRSALPLPGLLGSATRSCASILLGGLGATGRGEAITVIAKQGAISDKQ
jgi:SAM-dependent methyltransferase